MEKKSDSDVLDLVRLKALNEIGVALSAEKDGTRLLEMILEKAKIITFADGGTLYTRTDDNKLKFEIMLNDTLDIQKGGTSGEPIPFDPLNLHDENGEPNLHMVAVYSAIEGITINIPDAYVNTEFEFSGTQEFDKKTGYRSQSFLTVPMKDNDDEVIGVLQLLNALDPVTRDVCTFTSFEQKLVESLASQAAVALVNQRLLEGQRQLFESFIQLIATAIDDKSPYTGGHCRRVPELTMMLADAASNTQSGPLKSFEMNDETRYELKVSSWLHDCGKITTPEYVVDKATKLETIFDRIELIDTRFELLKRDAEIVLLKQKIALLEAGQAPNTQQLHAAYEQTIEDIHDDRAFIRRVNIGSEFMSDELKERVLNIAKRQWANCEGEQSDFLSENEIYNINITKGTLTPEERKIINYHIVATINMLESLPYPKYLKNVPEYAGGHHERMDGKGYPKGLTREQMSIPARVMGIADIFEALTARDRPYKKPMPLSLALTILGRMKVDNHIDPDLFDIFIHEKVYLQYAQNHLHPEQIDDVDVTQLPGYQSLD